MPISGLRACSLCYCKFDTQLGAAVPPICAPFTIAERVNFMHGYCERLKRHPEAHPGDRSDYKRMVAWAAEMHTHSITQEILTATQILPRLQAFLTGPGPDHHVQKRTPMNLLEELQVIFRKWSNGNLLADVNRGIVRETVQTTTGSRHVERLNGSSDRCTAGIDNVPLSTETGSRIPELQIGTCYAL